MRTPVATPETDGYWSSLLAAEVTGAGLQQVVAPYDGAVIAEVETCDRNHIDRALGAALRCHRDRDRWLPTYERIGILERTARLMTKEHAELALLASRESGKPISDTSAEVTRAIDTLRLAVNELRTNTGSVIPTGTSDNAPGRMAFTQHEPLGVVVAFGVFNQPFDLAVHQIVAAVAAGCPVIARPAVETPLSCLRFVKLLHQAGLARGWAQAAVTPDAAVAESLALDSRVGLFSFAGDAALGWVLRSRLACGTRCLLELGGAAPVLLAPDADRDLALDAVLRSGFYHAGQVGISAQKVYVPRHVARDFAEALATRATGLRPGDPTARGTGIGPMIGGHEVDRVHAWVREATGGGAQLLCGGAPRGDAGYESTVLLDPPGDARVSRLEIAGPVVCVFGYDAIEDALRAMNSLPTLIQGSVFTGEIDLAMRVYHRLRASTVIVNDRCAYRSDGLPITGAARSGLGTTGIPYAIRAMQIQKLILINNAR